MTPLPNPMLSYISRTHVRAVFGTGQKWQKWQLWQKRGRSGRNGLQSWTAPRSALDRGSYGRSGRNGRKIQLKGSAQKQRHPVSEYGVGHNPLRTSRRIRKATGHQNPYPRAFPTTSENVFLKRSVGDSAKIKSSSAISLPTSAISRPISAISFYPVKAGPVPAQL